TTPPAPRLRAPPLERAAESGQASAAAPGVVTPGCGLRFSGAICASVVLGGHHAAPEARCSLGGGAAEELVEVLAGPTRARVADRTL
ncbi:unnamed protein product, partial [Prorocentrum cordatum]